ncbi:hypothetical protein CCR75_007083 [Bremia lactucae]|uniref:RING-type domain-containing protein n=1 Tax=Bremia lactucae TaxID=4779 RepID=A0A976FGD9_BRELC|nr:hypothetical protein CCR75_007083 [Bremia lactucae]
MDTAPQQRVLADGWGDQSSGSVFCAESSLRYIYESNGEYTFSAPPRSFSQSTTRKGHPILKQDYTTESELKRQGVNEFEAAIARACTVIRKQAGTMPHSFCECAVCFSTNAYAQLSSCGHTFHPNCFLRWFRLNQSCPLCRSTVDKVQLAPTIEVQDELEAIMAELDPEPLRIEAPQPKLSERNGLIGSLGSNTDHLLSFSDATFDTDMELANLDDASADRTQSRGFEIGRNDVTDQEGSIDMDIDTFNQAEGENESYAVSSMYQFPPSSATPNYWNVLNQDIGPWIGPPAPAVPPLVSHSRGLVHLAPKTDAKVAQYNNQSPATSAVEVATARRVVACRCTGGCRNGRCACVKDGAMCGASCRCTSCKNPFLMVQATGANIDALLKDSCFMQNVSKTRDMVQRLQESVTVPCCSAVVQVVNCVHGYICKPCSRRYDFSWCHQKLLDSERGLRNHCAICKRCCDHRDRHCHDCGRCYFAGVSAGILCPCKEASRHKKRLEAARKDKSEDDEDEADGECCIM